VEKLIPEEATALVDLTQVSLLELGSLDDSVLAASLRRLLAEADNPQEVIALFQSCVLGDIRHLATRRVEGDEYPTL
jgi:FXSXX-COOH protein